MRNLLAILALAGLALALGGGLRGWYTIESVPAEPGRSAFRVEVDRVKVGQDLLAGMRALQKLMGKGHEAGGEGPALKEPPLRQADRETVGAAPGSPP